MERNSQHKDASNGSSKAMLVVSCPGAMVSYKGYWSFLQKYLTNQNLCTSVA